MTKDEILKKYEDDNEYHFHQVDREWIMEAMQEYADQQLAIQRVVVRSEKLKCYHYDHEWKSNGHGGNLKYCNNCKCYV